MFVTSVVRAGQRSRIRLITTTTALVVTMVLSGCWTKSSIERCTASRMQQYDALASKTKVVTDRSAAESRARALCEQQSHNRPGA